jgi:hypothetical protein
MARAPLSFKHTLPRLGLNHEKWVRECHTKSEPRGYLDVHLIFINAIAIAAAFFLSYH